MQIELSREEICGRDPYSLSPCLYLSTKELCCRSQEQPCKVMEEHVLKRLVLLSSAQSWAKPQLVIPNLLVWEDPVLEFEYILVNRDWLLIVLAHTPAIRASSTSILYQTEPGVHTRWGWYGHIMTAVNNSSLARSVHTSCGHTRPPPMRKEIFLPEWWQIGE